MFFELFAGTGAKERGPELGPSLTNIYGTLWYTVPPCTSWGLSPGFDWYPSCIDTSGRDVTAVTDVEIPTPKPSGVNVVPGFSV